MNITHIDISSLLPHDAPMLLLDTAIEADETTVKTKVTIHEGSLFCQGNAVGAWVGLEYMAQTIGVHAGFLAKIHNEPIRIGYLLGTRHYSCSVPDFKVGTTLDILAEREYLMPEEGLGSYHCSILIDGKEIASAVCTVYQPPKS